MCCKIDSSIIQNIAQNLFELLFINNLGLLKFIGIKNFEQFTYINQLKQTSQFRNHSQVINKIL